MLGLKTAFVEIPFLSFCWSGHAMLNVSSRAPREAPNHREGDMFAFRCILLTVELRRRRIPSLANANLNLIILAFSSRHSVSWQRMQARIAAAAGGGGGASGGLNRTSTGGVPLSRKSSWLDFDVRTHALVHKPLSIYLRTTRSRPV